MFVILVVDDDSEIREVFREVFLLAGYSVVAVCDGVEALDFLRSGLCPTVIVLDLEMPRMDGWSFLLRLRGVERSTVPVVVTSALVPLELPAGADLCLQKATDLGGLERAVAAMCASAASRG